jgi:hypothetical protein
LSQFSLSLSLILLSRTSQPDTDATVPHRGGKPPIGEAPVRHIVQLIAVRVAAAGSTCPLSGRWGDAGAGCCAPPTSTPRASTTGDVMMQLMVGSGRWRSAFDDERIVLLCGSSSSIYDGVGPPLWQCGPLLNLRWCGL